MTVPMELLIQISQLPIDRPEQRYSPHTGQPWQLDLAWPNARVGLLMHTSTGNRRPLSTREIQARDAALKAEGWRVVEISSRQVRTGEAICMLATALSKAEEEATDNTRREAPNCPVAASCCQTHKDAP